MKLCAAGDFAQIGTTRAKNAKRIAFIHRSKRLLGRGSRVGGIQPSTKSNILSHPHHMSNNQVRKKTNIKAANTVWTPKPSSILAMITPEHASRFIIQIKFFTPDHLTQNFRASQEEKFFIPDNLPPLPDS